MSSPSTAAILALLAVCANSKRRSFALAVDALVCGSLGLFLLGAPSTLLEPLTNVRVDALSLYVARILGVLLLSAASLSHQAYASNLPHQRVAVSMSRCITAVMIMLAAMHAVTHYTECNSTFSTACIAGALCWLVPNFYHLVSHSLPSSYNNYAVRYFLHFDHFLLYSAALAGFAFPQAPLRFHRHLRPNGVSVTLVRLAAAFLMGMASASRASLSVRHFHSQRLLLRTRFFAATAVAVLTLLEYMTAPPRSNLYAALALSGCLLWATNSVVGFAVVAYLQTSFIKAPLSVPCRPKRANSGHPLLAQQGVPNVGGVQKRRGRRTVPRGE